jgi:hypothetical protein
MFVGYFDEAAATTGDGGKPLDELLSMSVCSFVIGKLDPARIRYPAAV